MSVTVLMERTILGDGGTVALTWTPTIDLLTVEVNDQYGEFTIAASDGPDALDKFEHPYAHDTRERERANVTWDELVDETGNPTPDHPEYEGSAA